MSEQYGIKEGQRYLRADGTKNHFVVVEDKKTYAECNDVVVRDYMNGVPAEEPRRIDAFKLARVRYYLDPQ